ncbi:OCRL_2 [Blepharisma stoltei]|uniref:Rho-GAP domain-containing protein n=1 Tax=Blepharisma stoltei TaxID=1481888 RepID=A0AAU9J5J9_9CILI|nr:unnamed protein product [Blepharisma stoltei]
MNPLNQLNQLIGNPKKAIQGKLRDTEKIVHFEQVSAWIEGKVKNAFLVIVSNSDSPNELALFLYKPSRLLKINTKVSLLVVFPLTKELRIIPREKGYSVRWLDHVETSWEIKTNAHETFNFIAKHIEDVGRYQRAPFSSDANTHRWIWYYESVIPAQVRTLDENNERDFKHRTTVALLPEHFGSEIMNTYIKEQLQKRENEFTEIKDLKIMVGTWNAAGTAPAEPLISWLKCQNLNEDSPAEAPDLFLISLQEMCELKAQNILGSEGRKREWTENIKEQVNSAYPGFEYVLVADADLVGLLTLIFAKIELQQSIKNMCAASVKLGFKGYTGNKGAVSFRFEIFDTSICLINCHLAPHKNQTILRNKHIKIISKETKFNLEDGRIKNLFEHDFIFFNGDMNYRLNTLTSEEILRRIQAHDYRSLLDYDQLLNERRKQQMLADFTEGTINFRPTYKLTQDSIELVYNPKRDPAWCDRILYKGNSTLQRYGSCPYISQSDHVPVFGYFIVPVKISNQEAMNKLKDEVFKSVDEALHSPLPKLQISETLIQFTGMRYKVSQTKLLTVENKGYSIIPLEIRPNQQINTLKSWVSISPTFASVAPGQQFSFEITACFNEKQARKANAKQDYRSVMMILGIVGSSDYFIEVTCDFVGSCFGASCQDLIKIVGPIMGLKSCIKNAATSSSMSIELPKELYRIIEFIKDKGLRVKGLFEDTGNLEVLAHIRDVLDTGKQFNKQTDVHSMCSILIEFLESLSEPILPTAILDSACQMSESSQFALVKNHLFRSVDPISARVLEYIASFLKNLLGHRSFNGLSEESLAEYFLEPLTHAEELQGKKNASIDTSADPEKRLTLLALLISS